MKSDPITSIDILKFIDGEFRTAAREVFELHGLEIEERVEKFQCMPVVHKGNSIFSYTDNLSKFRAGDYVLLNPHLREMKSDMVGGGDKLVIQKLEEEQKRIILNDPYDFWGNNYDPARGEKCLIDVRPVERFPLYTLSGLGVRLSRHPKGTGAAYSENHVGIV